MSLLDSILNSQNGAAVQQIGGQLGLNDDQTTRALSALVPALAAGVHRNVQSSDGLSGLLGALTGGSHQQYLDDPSSLGQAGTVQDGNNILGHILGSKQVSRDVAAQASAHTGIGADILKKMLPLAATLMMGALASHTGRASGSMGSSFNPGAGMPSLGGGGGGLMDILKSTLGPAGAPGGSQQAGGGLGGLLGKLLGH